MDGSTAPVWDDNLLVGNPAMDRMHSEFMTLITTLTSVGEAELPAALGALALHAREHFAAEEAWMAESAFPAMACHADEHSAVLNSIDGVRLRVATGDSACARDLAAALVDWFPAHTTHLDSALSQWLCKQRLGGKPVVVRRSIAAGSTAPLPLAAASTPGKAIHAE